MTQKKRLERQLDISIGKRFCLQRENGEVITVLDRNWFNFTKLYEKNCKAYYRFYVTKNIKGLGTRARCGLIRVDESSMEVVLPPKYSKIFVNNIDLGHKKTYLGLKEEGKEGQRLWSLEEEKPLLRSRRFRDIGHTVINGLILVKALNGNSQFLDFETGKIVWQTDGLVKRFKPTGRYYKVFDRRACRSSLFDTMNRKLLFPYEARSIDYTGKFIIVRKADEDSCKVLTRDGATILDDLPSDASTVDDQMMDRIYAYNGTSMYSAECLYYQLDSILDNFVVVARAHVKDGKVEAAYISAFDYETGERHICPTVFELARCEETLESLGQFLEKRGIELE